MRVAYYGNNLNSGYFFVRALRSRGVEAELICPPYPHSQERHDWWTSEPANESIIRRIDPPPLHASGRLTRSEAVRALYASANEYDVLVLSEDGPAVFSELQSPRKVFVSFGADLQVIPFLLRRSRFFTGARSLLQANCQALVRGDLTAFGRIGGWGTATVDALRIAARIQGRQRVGLRQCDILVCGPHQSELVYALRLVPDRVRYLPLLMNTAVLDEYDPDESIALRRRYAGYDVVFFHPTRQYYLDPCDPFGKANEVLVRGFRGFCRDSSIAARLLMVRKGPEADIRKTQLLVGELGIGELVEWLPEMPNKRLRAYYTLPNVVVCDQFSPMLACLGNIGREASFFGRLLITAFRSWNRLVYGEDEPPHVLRAETEDEVASALHTVETMSADERRQKEDGARAWFCRHHAAEAAIPRWIDLLQEVACGTTRPPVVRQGVGRRGAA